VDEVYHTTKMNTETPLVRRLQHRYIAGAAAILPFGPLLYVQGQITRWKVGLLPNAAGETHGMAGSGGETIRLLVIGESTVAGLGARDHEHALAGRFAHFMSASTRRAVEWHVIGLNGVTARRTIDELVPQVPDISFDYVLLGIGGNDVMKLSSPRKWRHDMAELIEIMRGRPSHPKVLISNCPMIILSPVLPEPVKSILWRISRMHDENMRELAAGLDGVHYYPQPVGIDLEGFFADGIHPSERGYSEWAEAMTEEFRAQGAW